MKKKNLIFQMAICLGVLLTPLSAHAAAKLQVYPTRVEIKDGETSGFVTVINSGSSTGRYRADFTDIIMPESGALQPVPEGQQAPYSAQPYLRISPRSVTVPPGQSQKFRLLGRLPRDLPDGEYSTHLNVLMSSTDVEADEKPETGVSVRLRPHFRISLPVVLLKGETYFTSTIEDLRVEPHPEAKNVTTAVVEFTIQGNRSARGELVITFDQGGKTHELYKASGVGVYRDLPRRLHRARLEVPEGVSLSGGVLKATYTGEDGKLIAEKSVNL